MQIEPKYRFDLGDGKDTIVETSSTTGAVDTLAFGAGIDAEQLWFSRLGSDLEISVIGTQDSATVKDWYASTSNQLEAFNSGDGHSLLNNQVDALVAAMAAFAPPPPGQTSLPPEYQADLHAVIAANWH